MNGPDIQNKVVFHRALLAALVCLALYPLWNYFLWFGPFSFAAAALFALPREHRSRENAMVIGWSVGFGCQVFLLVL